MRTTSSLGALRALVFLAVLASAAQGQGAVIYVNDDATGAGDGSSWADAFPLLQPALGMAVAGDQVWVAVGTYAPITSANPTEFIALVDGVALYGGFDGTEATLGERAGLYSATILWGKDAASVSVKHVVTATGAGPSAVLDGFRVTEGSNPTPTGGAGMRIVNGSPTVRNTSFVGNQVVTVNNQHAVGGAVVIQGGSPLFEDCAFVENLARGAHEFSSGRAGDGRGGAVAVLAGAPKFHRCRFVRNEARGGEQHKAGAPGNGHGGALYVAGGSVLLAGSDFAGNLAHGGEDSLFAHGSGRGGAVYATADVAISQCRFTGNAAIVPSFDFEGQSAGGALYLDGEARVVQCTLANNVAHEGDGIFLSGGTLVLENSIAWANGVGEDDQLHVEPGAVPTVNWSCLQGLTGALGGTGNIGSDPSFLDLDGFDDVLGTPDDDLGLSAGSSCIDAASNADVPPDTFDLDGDGDTSEPMSFDLLLAPRFSDAPGTPDTGLGLKPLVDMGAHEFQGDFCQWNLGFQGPGAMALSLCGDDLTDPGSEATLLIANAPRNAPIALFAGLVNAPVPLKGGLLVPNPPFLTLIFPPAGAGGSFTLSVPGGGATSLTVFLQAASRDGLIFVFSNAIEAQLAF